MGAFPATNERSCLTGAPSGTSPRFVERPGKNQIIVPPGAVFAAKGPQQEERQKGHFEDSAAVRESNVQTLAMRTAP